MYLGEVVVLALVACVSGALPRGFERATVTEGLDSPTDLTFMPGSPNIAVVVQQEGKLLLLNVAQPSQRATYGTLPAVDGRGEKGALNLEFDPDFLNGQPFVYIYYSRPTFRLSRFRQRGTGLRARLDLGSELVLWRDTEPGSLNHYGGGLSFGPDKTLYLANGDHFRGNKAQDLSSTTGKVLRFRRDGSIPANNPGMRDGPGGNRADEVWAWGIRNGWRIHWDLKAKRLYIADVGGNVAARSSEEINLGVAGKNYGWPDCEGNCGNPDFPSCDCQATTDPVLTYKHNGVNACLIGGVVYEGNKYPPRYRGAYFFGDYTRGTVKWVKLNANGRPVNRGTLDDDVNDPIVSFASGPNGDLFIVGLFGSVRRYTYSAPDDSGVLGVTNLPVRPQLKTSSVRTPEGLEVEFSVEPADSSNRYLYVFGDGRFEQTASSTNTHLYTSLGTHLAYVQVLASSLNVGTVSNVVEIVNRASSPTVLIRQHDKKFRADDTIELIGRAQDETGRPIPPQRLCWELRLFHGDHTHPLLNCQQGRKLKFPVSINDGHGFLGNTGFEVEFSAMDRRGNLVATASTRLVPRKVGLKLASPLPITFRVDGVVYSPPIQLKVLRGSTHKIKVPPTTCIDGRVYRFIRWQEDPRRDASISVKCNKWQKMRPVYQRRGQC